MPALRSGGWPPRRARAGATRPPTPTTTLTAQDLAIGARGTFIGKAFLYGLGALGQAGVSTALELIRKELDITMALGGIRDVADLDREALWQPSSGSASGATAQVNLLDAA